MRDIIDDNFGLHSRHIPSLHPSMTVKNMGGFTYVDSGLPCDTFNIIHIYDGSQMDELAFYETLEMYRSKQFPFCIWIDDYNREQLGEVFFEKKGLTIANEEPGMLLDLEQYTYQRKASPITIVMAENKKQVEDFANVVAENWNPPDQWVKEYYCLTASSFLPPSDHAKLFVAYVDDKPVSVIEVFPSDDKVAGLYALATLQAFRGKGIGSAIFHHCLHYLKEQGFTKAILQASADGINIYRKSGFVLGSTYFEYQYQ